MATEAVFHFDTRTLHDLEQHLQQLGLLLDKTAEAACVIAQLMRQCDEVWARRRRWPVPPTALLEYCVCVQYDAVIPIFPSSFLDEGGHGGFLWTQYARSSLY